MLSDTEKSLGSIVKGAGIVFVGIAIGSILGLINQFLMGRILGPKDYGLFNLGISVMVIFCVLPRFGLGAALTQFVPYNLKIDRRDKVASGIRFALFFGLICSAVISIIVFSFADYISSEIFHKEELSIILKILSMAIPFWVVSNTLGALMQAFKRPSYYVYVENVAMKILQIGIFIAMFFIGYKIIGALFAYLCSLVFITAAYAYILFYKIYPSQSILKETKKTRVPIKRELVTLSFPLFLAGFTFLFMEYTDRILLGIYMTPEHIGIYSAAFTIASMLLFIFTSFGFNFRPVASECYASKDIEGMRRLYVSVTKWIFILTLPAVVYLSSYAERILELIYGDAFIGGSIPLAILSWGIAMNGLTGLTGEVLIATKKTKLNLLTEIIGAVFNIFLNILLIPSMGIIGAAIGTSLSITIKNLFSLGFVYRELGIQPYNYSFIRIIFASATSIGGVYYALSTFTGSEWNFIMAIPLGIISYLALLKAMHCLDDSEKSFLKSMVGIKPIN